MGDSLLAKGAIIVLMGTTISVAGEAFDCFVKKTEARPKYIYLIPTTGTKDYAQLAKLAILDKYYREEPVVRIRPFSHDDILSESDFVDFFNHVSSVVREILGIVGNEPIFGSITGGRKTMSVAAAMAMLHRGVRVIDTRSRTAEEDRAYLSQIASRFSEGASPEEVFNELREHVVNLVFRPADICYELPSMRLNAELTYERLDLEV
ncbi:MAG: hypothetical protein PWP76_305 [Candidatus Diapherotrites archaeon]|nr:hypothetical protein [Candidatus Diapherotrites archaeon]MDN5366825.1 hypothetical protein [Candidatus Diapherotrites archaeon]